MKQYDYLIVGAGLFGAVAAYRAARSGKKALVIDRRPHTGGNAYCEEREGIRVHKYGAHILGYMGGMDAADWEKYEKEGYSMDAYIGQSGFEEAFEEYLHGIDGQRVDVVLESVDARAGRLDFRLA